MTYKRNISIESGTYFELVVEMTDEDGEPIDYTGNEALAQFRKSYQSINSISFDTSIDINIVTVSIEANATVNVAPGKYIYDVIVRDPNDPSQVEKLIEGIVTINPTASKWPA